MRLRLLLVNWDTELTRNGPKLRPSKGNNVLDALAKAVGDGDVLIHLQDNGSFHVAIAYGADTQTRERFDECEWGCAPTLIEALRFALGAHFHVEDE